KSASAAVPEVSVTCTPPPMETQSPAACPGYWPAGGAGDHGVDELVQPHGVPLLVSEYATVQGKEVVRAAFPITTTAALAKMVMLTANETTNFRVNPRLRRTPATKGEISSG